MVKQMKKGEVLLAKPQLRAFAINAKERTRTVHNDHEVLSSSSELTPRCLFFRFSSFLRRKKRENDALVNHPECRLGEIKEREGQGQSVLQKKNNALTDPFVCFSDQFSIVVGMMGQDKKRVIGITHLNEESEQEH